MGVVGSLGEERLRAWKGDSVWLKVNSGDPRLCFGQRVEKRRWAVAFCWLREGSRQRRRKNGLGLGFFLLSFFLLNSQNYPLVNFLPLFVCVVTSIYRQSGLVSKTRWSLNFFIFCQFWFFFIFFIFESEQYQRRLNKENQWL